jgi:hypothetical protein
MEMTETKKRHPFRFLFKFLLFIGAMTAISKFMAERKKDFYGLTESEARAKFEAKLGPRIGEDKASAVADQVIPRLKEKGVIKSDAEGAVEDAKRASADATESVVDAAKDAGESVVDAAKDAGDSVQDAVEKIEEKVD